MNKTKPSKLGIAVGLTFGLLATMQTINMSYDIQQGNWNKAVNDSPAASIAIAALAPVLLRGKRNGSSLLP
jgi:hypothetical protein